MVAMVAIKELIRSFVTRKPLTAPTRPHTRIAEIKPGYTAVPGTNQRGHNCGQRHGHTQRQVNFAGDQQEGHTDGCNSIHTKVRQQLIDVICAGEVGHKPDAVAQNQDEDQDDVVLRKQFLALFHRPVLLSLRI